MAELTVKMCRNKSDRRILVAALERIANPPESVQGQTGHLLAHLDNATFSANIVGYMQTIAEETLEKVKNGNTSEHIKI